MIAGADQRSRRDVIASLGAGMALSMAGCSGVLPGSSGENEVDPADFDCEIKDVGLTLHADGTVEPWYKC